MGDYPHVPDKDRIMKLKAILLAAVTLILSAAPLHAGPTKAKKLNIIWIVTDDQAAWTIGAYGNRESKTPNMDRLAREGALFKNAFCPTPVCSPSRASIFTGRYGTQVKITDWTTPDEAKRGVGLPSGISTWPLVLQRAGYRTGLIGKWHLGEPAEHHPTKRGFDFFVGFLGGGNKPIDPTLEIDHQTKSLKGSLPDILTDTAIDFVEKNKANPFALVLAFREPHAP